MRRRALFDTGRHAGMRSAPRIPPSSATIRAIRGFHHRFRVHLIPGAVSAMVRAAMRYVLAGLLGAFLGAGFGPGGFLPWLGVVFVHCAIHDAFTAKRRARDSRLACLR